MSSIFSRSTSIQDSDSGSEISSDISALGVASLYRHRSDTGVNTVDGVKADPSLRRASSGSGRYNKILSRLASDHWKEDGEFFRREEEKRRNENIQQTVFDCNDNEWTHTKLFFSHCWRDENTQARKRMLFSALTFRGNVFWADFLDLQARGPVPWRKEIGDAIQACSKFLAAVDLQYLLSFNCLEELEYAIKGSKPIVVAVLDQEAWNLLTIIGGVQKAWTMQPEGGGLSLENYEGQLFGPSMEPFDLKRAESIFTTIASINFCPCRELEFAAIGHEAVSLRLADFVERDLDYTKEHSFLLTKAEAWEEAGKPPDLLLEGKADVNKWKDWVAVANKVGTFPPVTDLQADFVRKSVEKQAKRQGLAKIFGVSAVVVIFVLMVTAFSLLTFAVRQAETSKVHATNARLQGAIAVRKERIAATMLLASFTTPTTSSELRAVVRASEIAENIGFPSLVLPYLQATIEHVMGLQYWFMDVDTHSAPVHSVAFSPDGLYLASGGRDLTVRIRPMPEGEGLTGVPPFRTDVYLKSPGIIEALAWAPSGDLLAASFNHQGDNGVPAFLIWRHDTQRHCWREVFRVEHSPQDMNRPRSLRAMKALAWSPDSEILATGNENAEQILWYVGDAIRFGLARPDFLEPDYGIHMEPIRALDFSPNGGQLALGGLSDNIMLVGISTMPRADANHAARNGTSSTGAYYMPTHISAARQDDDINSLAFSPDGTLLAGGGDDTFLRIYRIPSNATLDANLDSHQLLSHETGPFSSGHQLEILNTFPALDDYDTSSDAIKSLQWSLAGDVIGTASKDKKVRLYKNDLGPAEHGDRAAAHRGWHLTAILDSMDRPNSLAMPPKTHKGLLSVALESNSVRSWQPAAKLGRRGPEWFNLDCIEEIKSAFNEKFQVRSASLSPDGNSLVASSYRGHICVWERSGDSWNVSAVLDFPQHPEYYHDKGYREATRAVSFSPSGRRFLAADDAAGMHVWQRAASGWEPLGNRFFDQLANNKVRVIAWSWDEKWVAGAGFASSGVWNVDNKDSPLQELDTSGEGVKSAAWRHNLDDDGCYTLATGEGGNILRIRQLCPVNQTDGTVTLSVVKTAVHHPAEHIREIQALAWSSTGILASASPNGMVAVHTFEHAQITSSKALPGHTSKLYSMAWAPDGLQLATSATEGSVILWDLQSDQAGQGQGYSSWLVKRQCRYVFWTDKEPRRLACARQSQSGRDPLKEDPPFSYSLMFSLVDFQQQLSILRELQYGSLHAGDLSKLGLNTIASTAMDREFFAAPPDSKHGICEAS